MYRRISRFGLALATLGACLALLLPGGSASAQTGAEAPTNPSEAAAAWLADQFTGGLLPGYTPGSTDIGLTLQAIIGFAATGTENTTARAAWATVAADVDAAVQVGGVDAPGRLGLMITAAVALGEDPTNVGGVDLVARLLASQQPSGLFGTADPTYDGAFRQGLALLGLSAAGVTNPAGTNWLLDQRCVDGSYVAFRADTTVPCPAVDAASFVGPDTNSTALALLGLSSQGMSVLAAPSATWLLDMHDATGAVPYFGDPSLPGDANSTALVVAAIRGFATTPATQLDGLMTFQLACDSTAIGAFAFQPDTDGVLWPDTFATAQALWALGAALPVADATMAEGGAAACASTTTTTSAPTTSAPSTTGAIVTTTTAAIVETTTTPIATLPPTTSSTTTSSTSLATTSTTSPTTTAPPSTTIRANVAGAQQASTAQMARTGSNSLPLTLGGAVLIGLGIALLTAARRRS